MYYFFWFENDLFNLCFWVIIKFNKWMYGLMKVWFIWYIMCFFILVEIMVFCRFFRVRECFCIVFCKVWKDWCYVVDFVVGLVVDFVVEFLICLILIWVRLSFCVIVGMIWGFSFFVNWFISCLEGDLDSRYFFSFDKSIYVIYIVIMDYEL